MACFLVTHRLLPELSPARLLAEEKRVIRHLPREIKWVMSWLEPEQELVVTHWDAPTGQCVLAQLEHTGLARLMPVLALIPAVEVYPKRRILRGQPARRSPGRARRSRPPRVWSGALAESMSATLQNRSARTHTG
jgi:hypothetical protein